MTNTVIEKLQQIVANRIASAWIPDAIKQHILWVCAPFHDVTQKCNDFLMHEDGKTKYERIKRAFVYICPFLLNTYDGDGDMLLFTWFPSKYEKDYDSAETRKYVQQLLHLVLIFEKNIHTIAATGTCKLGDVLNFIDDTVLATTEHESVSFTNWFFNLKRVTLAAVSQESVRTMINILFNE